MKLGDTVRITTPGRETHAGRVTGFGEDWVAFQGTGGRFTLDTQTIRNSAVVYLKGNDR